MNTDPCLSRRHFLTRCGSHGLGLASLAVATPVPTWVSASETPVRPTEWIRSIVDPEIRAGVEAAVFKNLLPAATERVYPGHFTINADGGRFGTDTTWPGLDSWQMIGPYLHLGRTAWSGLLRVRAGLASAKTATSLSPSSMATRGQVGACGA